MQTTWRKWLVPIVLIAVAAGGGYAWWRLKPVPLPPGIALANGRIEATQIDVATKLAGRIKDALVAEGDYVEAGQTLARMDTSTLEAELRQADAQLAMARNAVATAEAVVEQRDSELRLASNTLKRSEELIARGFISTQKLDADRTQMLTAKAGLVAARSQAIQAQSSVKAAAAAAERIKSELDDAVLKAPRAGRVQYRLAEPGEVLAAGGKVVSLLDLTDVYMTVFLPEATVGKIAIGAEARLVIDAAPQYVIPARVSFVATEAQFTPKTVETASEREKLVFRVKAQIDPALLRAHRAHVKAGMPGVAYVQIDRKATWPEKLEVRLPEP
ncbi:MAG TPA: HlyD family efflux transporter periplasmic adaptor subunit [Casimicrobiaceae bacterium]